jgi:hypothetical protein
MAILEAQTGTSTRLRRRQRARTPATRFECPVLSVSVAASLGNRSRQSSFQTVDFLRSGQHHPGLPAAHGANATPDAIRAPAPWPSWCIDRESAACRVTFHHAFDSEPCPGCPEPCKECLGESSHRNEEHVAWGNASFLVHPRLNISNDGLTPLRNRDLLHDDRCFGKYRQMTLSLHSRAGVRVFN